MRYLSISLIAAFVLNTANVQASTGGIVEAMQMPAWYDRDGQTYPLKPGIKLYSGDIIRTGKDSRALLRMDEGSSIKLGEDARLSINTLSPPKQEQGIFAALMRITRGAFRFTTTELGKQRKRNVDVKIGHVTVGIRGTDIWGRSSTDKDLFCLIEGNVSVQRDGEAEFIMQEPLQFIIAEKDKSTAGPRPVDMNKLGGWAAQTDTQPGRGILTVNGEWAVNMMSLQNADSALKLQQVLHAAGYAAEIREIQINQKHWSRIRIEGFASRDDASSFAGTINKQYGIKDPWVVKF